MALGIVAFLAMPQAAAAASKTAQPGHFQLNASLDFSQGDYGQQTTTKVLYLPVTLQYTKSRWRFRATLPWVRISGSQTVIDAGGDVLEVNPGTTTVSRNRSGVGDMSLKGGYLIVPKNRKLPYLELWTRIKVPTASRGKGLGTGKTDYTVGGDLFRRLGKVLPYLSLGYRFRGDTAARPRNNTFQLSTGFSYDTGTKWRPGLNFSYREASTSRSSDRVEISPSLSWRPGKHWRLGLRGSAGLSRSVPNFGIGLSLRYVP